jgi:hypothetical protein
MSRDVNTRFWQEFHALPYSWVAMEIAAEWSHSHALPHSPIIPLSWQVSHVEIVLLNALYSVSGKPCPAPFL